MATHSSTLAWKIPWTEEPGRLQSMGSLRVGQDWATSLSCTGEGNGNPLQCSCLENPRDGAWWAAVYGVAESQTRLERLSSSSSSSSSKYPLLIYDHIASVVSNSLRPHGLQHICLPCPSPSPGACSNLGLLSHRCHPTISSSVISFSSCLLFFPASGSFQQVVSWNAFEMSKYSYHISVGPSKPTPKVKFRLFQVQ